MTNDDDMIICEAARRICAARAFIRGDKGAARYLSGAYDNTVWMCLVEKGIRKGIEIGRSIIK